MTTPPRTIPATTVDHWRAAIAAADLPDTVTEVAGLLAGLADLSQEVGASPAEGAWLYRVPMRSELYAMTDLDPFEIDLACDVLHAQGYISSPVDDEHDMIGARVFEPLQLLVPVSAA